jgi:hypothetical protein
MCGQDGEAAGLDPAVLHAHHAISGGPKHVSHPSVPQSGGNIASGATGPTCCPTDGIPQLNSWVDAKTRLLSGGISAE